ncbi:MAG: transporter substrate-binding domain-containing protein [Desulfobulbaceae bacterium]|nr:transporter substrate-binding domain-containing protein [Desulfobulbaceae bacterium]
MIDIRFRRCHILILFILLFPISTNIHAASRPQSITVVMDNNYPPYVFQNSDGKLQGILIDQWRLWEQKTGIKVEISGMDWCEAINRMHAGDFDVIDTIFKSEERSSWLDFSPPYAKIEVPIFFDKDISGLSDAASLRGFPVATKSGDDAVDLLKRSGVDNLLLFNSYEAVIRAAKEHKVNIFVIDKPPALYFLNKYGIQEQFKHSAPLNIGEFHRAVYKGKNNLLQLVQEGFNQISTDELQEIEKTWSGSSILDHFALRYFFIAAGCLSFIILILSAWNRILRKAVNSRTKELLLSEQRFQTIFHGVNDAIFIHDIETGSIVDVNQKMCEMYGFTHEEACRMTVEEGSANVPPYSHAEAIGWMKKAAQGEPQLFEWFSRKKNGELFWVEVNMRRARIDDIDRILVTARDISERKRVEKALQESESRYRLLFESAGDAIFILRHETIVSCNQKALKLFACESKEQLINESLLKFSPDKQLDDHPSSELVLQKITDALHGESQFYSWQHKRCDSVLIETEVSLTHIDLGEAGNLLAIIRDISAKKEVEIQLHQAQKMESLGTLAGGIAHDFNNILSAIIGYTDMAKLRRPEEAVSLQEDLQQVSLAAIRAANLARQILTFSRNQKQQKMPLRISLIVKEALALLRASIPTTIEIQQEIVSRASVQADATQIHQLVMNLCTNAYQAMMEYRGGGILCVTLKEIALEQALQYRGTTVPPGDYVMLLVSDTGNGMDQMTVTKIFDPYFTTKEVGKGTGLGLAVVHGIVQDHHGQIIVYSEPGRGTTFTVYLPIIAEEATVATYTDEPSISTAHQRIMVVDDERAIREYITFFLTEAGYQVEGYSNGLEAWQALSARPSDWDLIVTDQTMPKMTGEKLASKAHEIRPNLPIILCSGYNPALHQEGEEKTKVIFLQKPIDRRTILTQVAMTLATG